MPRQQARFKDHFHTPRMWRTQRGFNAWYWLLGLVSSVLLLLIVAIIVITHWDWNSARPWVAERVSETTGRQFSIGGDLNAEWHWPQPLESGWRRWIPGVTVVAENVRIGNPDGFAIEEEPEGAASGSLPPVPAKMAEDHVDNSLSIKDASQSGSLPASAASGDAGEDAPSSAADAEDARRLMSQPKVAAALAAPERSPQTMATVARATATLRLLPLLSRTVTLDTVALTAPDVALGRTKEGDNNWTFKGAQKGASPAWTLSLGQLIIQDGWIAYADGMKDLALRAHIDTLAPDDDASDGTADSGEHSSDLYGLHITVHGRLGKARIEGEALAGPILSLRRTVVNYPLHFKARAGSLRAEGKGILANPRDLSGMDLQVALRGSSMADFYALTGLVLPNTPAFKTSGRLLGSLGEGKAVWEYRDFDGTVGSSDIHGSLTYTSAKPRSRLEGRMLSKKLRLVDLGPLIGKSDAKDAKSHAKGRVLPNTPFETGRWNAMDLDIGFSGEKIIRSASLPIENLSTRAVLKDGQLTLDPLRFGVARGKINAQLQLDSREKPLKAKLQGSADDLQLSALFPKVELMHKSFGRLDGGFSLAARGDSVGAMLGHSSGDIKFFIRNGTFSKELLDLAALNLGSVVVTKLFGGDKEVQLRCAVADLGIRDGIATTRVAKLSTPEAVVEATGAINLRDERMDLRIKPESLKWKFFSLRTPLYVKGSFAEPDVGVEPGPLLLRAGAAVAAAVVAPAALALVPVTVPGAQDDANCKALLDKVQ